MPRLFVTLLMLSVACCVLKVSAQEKPSAIQKSVAADAKTRVPMNLQQVRTYVLPDDLKNAFVATPPASCAEWAGIPPTLGQYSVDKNCKYFGGTIGCCDRCRKPHDGTYSVGPSVAQTQVGKPITVHFKINNFGVGDYVIYAFGKVDWGDNSQQDLLPFGYDVALTHTYTSAKTYVLNVMGGAQFKYHGDGSCSYECCVDNTIKVIVKP